MRGRPFDLQISVSLILIFKIRSDIRFTDSVIKGFHRVANAEHHLTANTPLCAESREQNLEEENTSEENLLIFSSPEGQHGLQLLPLKGILSGTLSSENCHQRFHRVAKAAAEHHLTPDTPLYAETCEQNSEEEPIRGKPFDLQLSVRSTWTPTFTSQRNTSWSHIIRKCEPKFLTQFYMKS
ncbi:hypothetical protein CDAR_574921 [Caerostris darwini]|uniref:Uncharacterized protein n=1 Tax=Caerostris darwini TaxID=1538125 RepID=A0AAV4SWG4_9ARAC|nr:hypothetical protein CDAR_574921 [Caerostris darwini]